MKYTANCPACSTDFEIGGPAAAQSGLQCPYCATGFVPEKIHRLTVPDSPAPTKPAPELHAATHTSEYNDVKRYADIASGLGALALCFAAIGLLIAFVMWSGDENGTAAWFLGSTGLLSAGFWLLLLGQLFQIRAGIEKSNLIAAKNAGS